MKKILYNYIFVKINELLEVIGTKHIKKEELTPEILVELDPLGIIAATFKTILENLNEKNRKLKSVNEKLNILFNTINDGIYIVNKDYDIIMINNIELKFLNKSREDVIGKKCFKIFAKRDYACNECKIKHIKHLKSPAFIPHVNLKKLNLRQNCPRELVDLCFFPIFENEYLVYIRDLSEANKNIKKIQLERETLSVIINSMLEGIILIDNNFKIKLTNSSVEKILKKKENRLLNEDICTFFSSEFKEKLQKSKKEKITRTIYNYKYNSKFLEISIAPIITGKDIEGLVVICRDITERKKIEEELIKMEKLESVGFLAGGIAHDFNNILTAALGNIELCKIFKNNSKKLDERLLLLEKSIFRAKSLTDKLLTFARGGTPVKEIVDIKLLIKETVEFAISGTNIEVQYSFQSNLWKANVDPNLISQVFTNLTINAKNAIAKQKQEKGIIHISVENCQHNKEYYLKILFSDNGCGIPENIISKIFDPFFTTDKSHSGLGLAIIFNIIKNHNGTIDVKSEIGKGTEFKLTLPASLNEIRITEFSEKNSKAPQKKIKKILLMDDDNTLRNAAKQILELNNYIVFDAKNGEEAVKIFKKENIDLTILDLTIIGGMGGKETIKILRQINPNVKAIVTSGYSRDPVLTYYKRYGFTERLVKPFLFSDFLNIIKKVI